jgi:hypothetical protein
MNVKYLALLECKGTHHDGTVNICPRFSTQRNAAIVMVVAVLSPPLQQAAESRRGGRSGSDSTRLTQDFIGLQLSRLKESRGMAHNSFLARFLSSHKLKKDVGSYAITMQTLETIF